MKLLSRMPKNPGEVSIRWRRLDGRPPRPTFTGGAACPVIAGCLDLDLSFTPATNMLPLPRLDLSIGRVAELRSAWLEWPAGTLGLP